MDVGQGRELGARGEAAALAVYVERGYGLVARNWRCAIGELDLVLSRGSELVFCEVKSRRGSSLGGPFEAVDRRKQRKLRALAEAFLATSGSEPSSVRFDVASVLLDVGEGVSVHVFEQAF
jgi:putative endonuclease